jgi:Leucine-rich repeat (LRR) protein
MCVFNDVDIRRQEVINIVANHQESERTDNDVRRAEFKMSYLSYFPEKIFQKFSHLESLKVYNLEMLEVKKSNFEGASNLMELDLGLNKLTKLEAETFVRAPRLQKVKLDQNRLKEIDEKAFQGLSNLKSLNLGTNNIKVIHKNTFKWNPNLEEIRLTNNAIETLPKELFFSNYNIKVIDFSQNKIRSMEAPHMFHQLNKLTFLYLANNLCVNNDFIESQINSRNLETKLENCGIPDKKRAGSKLNSL